MDVGADSETPPTHTSLGEPVLEQELNLCCAHAQTESGGNISLQLLAFRTQLLEAVEELHIRRDAETRFEAQISKTVLEKQELEWEKESLQHRFESVTNQHTESLTNLKKQAKLRNTEEEKGKHQVIAALKDKEINNLKEELKSLQLQKYNLEKKSSELEQKLALQSRTKDSHLNQLGEVEKRFSALSRQCAVVKQAHEKLEQNVDEAMRINKKLTSANERQEATIVLLKKELDEVSNELTKAKMTVVRHGEPRSPAGGEREHVRQLQQRLKLETEMNERLREENEAERAEKQEVIRSLQHSQQLLLSQTQIVRRGDVELQTQRRMYEGLKQEHEVMREKSKAVEDKVAELMESYEASRTSWDKERTRLLDRIKNEQEDLRALKEAYDDLHQKHTELSSQAQSHTQHIQEMEVRGSRQALGVSTRPARVDEIRGEEPLGEPVHRSELPGLGALQHSISSQAKNPAAAAATLTATEATEGQKVPKQQSQTGNGPLSRPDTPCCPVATNSSLSLGADSGSAATDAVTLNRTVNSAASERSPDARPDVTSAALPVSDDGVQIMKGCCVRGITASSPECSSLTESVNLLTDMKSKDGNTGMKESEQEEDDGTQGNGHREEEEANMGQQRDEEGVQGEDVEEGGGAGEKRAAGDRRTRGEDSEGSAEDAETETKDRASGVKERAKTAAHTPQTQIRAQTITDSTAEKSPPLQVTDSTDAEPPPHVCEPSDVCQKVSGTDAECKHLRNQREAGRDGEYQSVCRGQREVTGQCSLRDAESRNHQSGFHLPETTRENPLAKTAGEFSAAANRHAGGQSGGHAGGFAGAEELGTSQTQAEVCDPSVIPDMKQTDEKCDTHTSENVSEAEQLSRGGTEQKDGRERDYSACKGGEGQSDACESRRTPVEKSHYKEDITMDTINLQCEVETERIQKAADAKKSGGEPGVKLPPGPGQGHRRPASGETQLGDSADSSLPRRKTLGPLFDWGAAERQTPNSRAKSGGSGLHQLIQGTSPCEPTIGFPGRPPSATIPTFLRSKLDDVPSAIVRASDLLDAGSVSGTAPSLRRRQQGLWEAKEERCRERTAAETVTKVLDGRARLPGRSFPASSTGSKLPRPTAAACSRVPTLAAGASSESDWKLSCSHEREDQQASFRAQISKIEQLLNAEELHLPKRQRTEPNL